MRAIIIIMFLAIVLFICSLFVSNSKKEAEIQPRTDEWQQGEFITLRRIYPHQRCGGQLVFNGQSERAPYSEKDTFYTHVCDHCSATNQILNQTWPQYKREWRSK